MEPDAEDEVLRGELDPAKARLRPYILALERLQAWRNNVPLFYDTMVQDRYAVPCPTLQLHPHTQPDVRAPHALTRHALLVGESNVTGQTPAVLLRGVAVPHSCAALARDPHSGSRGGSLAAASGLYDVQEYDRPEVGAAVAPLMYDAVRFSHPLGGVDRLRYCPAAPHLVATKCDGGGLALLDLRPYLTHGLGGLGSSGSGNGGSGSTSGAGAGAAAGAAPTPHTA